MIKKQMMYCMNWQKYISFKRSRQTKSVIGLNGDYRTALDSDFGRVVFCSAMRRMHDKTQVFPLTSGDKVHTRLTHSLEVMSIAKSLAINLCQNEKFVNRYGKQYSCDLERQIISILTTVALIHDIGNPPFGHHGETTIQAFFKKYFASNPSLDLTENQKYDFTEFDGNAEGLRILSKTQYLGDTDGLNLTYATLGAYMKYPNIQRKMVDDYVGNKKHGVFHSEIQLFNNIVDSCSLRIGNKIKRHPLTFLLEAADTISYLVMDLEDGIATEKKSFTQVLNNINVYIYKHIDKTNEVLNLSRDIYNPSTENFYVEKLIQMQESTNNAKKIVNFRVALINYFMKLVINNFIENLEKIDNGRYNYELLYDDPLQIAKLLGDFERKNVFNLYHIVSAELTGEAVIKGILNIVIPKVVGYKTAKDDNRIFEFLPYNMIQLIHQECGLYDPKKNEEFIYQMEHIPTYWRLRLVVDWIAGMTDKYALETYQRLSGMKLT